ncbi:MAG: hypothetical protein ACXWQO_06065 [Bdellovibrionota bacterium]
MKYLFLAAFCVAVTGCSSGGDVVGNGLTGNPSRTQVMDAGGDALPAACDCGDDKAGAPAADQSCDCSAYQKKPKANTKAKRAK